MDSDHQLGPLVSAHLPSKSFGRGWPAWIAGGLFGICIGCAFVVWAIAASRLKILGAAAVMFIIGAAAFTSGRRAMHRAAWVFEKGIVVRDRAGTSAFNFDDVEGWAIVATPGRKKRYEESAKNIVRIHVVTTENPGFTFSDQLSDFMGLHDAIAARLERSPTVQRIENRWT